MRNATQSHIVAPTQHSFDKDSTQYFNKPGSLKYKLFYFNKPNLLKCAMCPNSDEDFS